LKVITVCTQKGGTAKTTTAISLGAGLVRAGKRVLLLDLDSSRDLTKSMGIFNNNLEYTSDYVINGKSIKKAIIKLDNGLHIVPGSNKLIGTIIGLKKTDLLNHAVNDIRYNYDYMIIDTAPSISVLTIGSLKVSDLILLCFQPEYLPLTGIKDLIDIIDTQKEKYRINPKIKILVTMYDQRKLLHKEAVKSIKKHFKSDVLKTLIRTCVSLAEAPSHFKTIYEYSPLSHASQDYQALTEEILKEIK